MCADEIQVTPNPSVAAQTGSWPRRHRPTGLQLYVAALIAAAVAVAVAVASLYAPWPPLWVVLSLGVLAAVAERSRIRLSPHTEVSISLLPMLFAAVALGPLAALCVGSAAMLGDLRRPYMKWAVYTSVGALTGAITGVGGETASHLSSSELGSIAVATFAGALLAQIVDAAFAAATLAVRQTGEVQSMLRTLRGVMPSSVLLSMAVVAPLVFVYENVSTWAVLFFVLPAIAMHRLFSMYQEQRQLARDLAEVNGSLERANLSFASALVTTLDARDRYTAGHSAAVAVYARDIAARLGLAPSEQQLAHLAGLVHDIGKIGVAPGILEKPGPLSLAERRKMEEHPAIGERILSNVEAYFEIARIVRHHHERIDGMGYPDGLGSEDIPLISRIICVADAYNAMTSDRPYRDAMPVSVARDRLLGAAGTQFDEQIVAAFDAILENAEDEYTRAGWAVYSDEASTQPALVALPVATAA